VGESELPEPAEITGLSRTRLSITATRGADTPRLSPVHVSPVQAGLGRGVWRDNTALSLSPRLAQHRIYTPAGRTGMSSQDQDDQQQATRRRQTHHPGQARRIQAPRRPQDDTTEQSQRQRQPQAQAQQPRGRRGQEQPRRRRGQDQRESIGQRLLDNDQTGIVLTPRRARLTIAAGALYAAGALAGAPAVGAALIAWGAVEAALLA